MRPLSKRSSSGTLTALPRQVVPLHHRVYVMLAEKIADGSFRPDETMPSEAELQEVFGVSRVTVRKALDRLVQEGQIVRHRGRGTFPVAKPRKARSESRALRSQVSLALRTTVKLLSYAIEPATDPVCAALECPPQSPALRIMRVRRDQSSPISVTQCWLPADLAPILPKHEIGRLPISAALAARGLKLADFRERVSATMADAELAELLEIEVGAPLLTMTRTVRTEDGRVVEFLRALYRPDRYEYRVAYTAEERERPGSPWQATIADKAD